MMMAMVHIDGPGLDGFIILDIDINAADSGIGKNFFYLFTEFVFGNHKSILHVHKVPDNGKTTLLPSL